MSESFKWLDGLNKHYQPIYKYEDYYVDKGKISEERVGGFYKILNNILEIGGNPENKRYLDIGSNLGWFCFKLNELGADCIGLEINNQRVKLCNTIKDQFNLEGLYFINNDSIEWIEKNSDMEIDYVLLLNTFHHILVQNEKGAWCMFNHLINTTKGVIIMMRSSYKGWKLEYPKNIPYSIVEQSEATHYKKYERIHGRTIYHFYKEEMMELPTTPTKL